MSEQTYMNLKDAVKRPKFDLKNINRANTQFKRLVDNYQKWNEDEGLNEPRSTYEDDIIECLGHYDLDGYQLAKYLHDYKYVEPNTELVDILDDALFVKSSLEREMFAQWVKENFLTIPEDVVGKKVNAKQNLRKYEDHYITGIRPDTYQVTVSENATKQGGWIVGFENVTFVN
jgi:hypothetical protein